VNIWHQFGFDSQIVVIHPNYRQQRQLLFTLMNLSEALYLRADFREALESNADFGGHFLILDEFDRLSDDEAAEFLTQVLNTYPKTAIVIFSRDLPQLSEEQRNIASIFPIDEEMGLIDFYQQTNPVLEFFGFGRGAIAINGRRKEQYLRDEELELLFYLLENGRSSRDTLMKVLWNELHPKTAIKTLHNLKPHLKDVLGVDPILYHEGFYQLNPELEIIYDVDNYRKLIDKAYYAETNLSMVYFAQAHDIYKSDFFQLSHASWTIALRQNLLQTQADTQACLGQLHTRKAEKEQAATWYSFAFKANPVRDDVLRALLRLFVELKMPAYAGDFFNRYEKTLQDKYGISPSKDFEAFLEVAGVK
jgi:DNA-binding SARP family transcriptional activator